MSIEDRAITNLQDNIKLVDMLEDVDEQADGVAFSWWDDQTLIDFAMDFDKTKLLDEDNSQSLTYELARRLDEYLTSYDETD